MKASSNAAISIVNATATGRGCSLAIKGGIEADWQWQSGPLNISGAPDDKVAKAVLRVLASQFEVPTGANVTTRGRLPHSVGLKTSSSAAGAMMKAASLDADLGLDELSICRLATQACRAAGVTITGAFDDQVATTMGGCAVTNNETDSILAHIEVPDWEVALWLPPKRIDKAVLREAPVDIIADQVKTALAMALEGDIPGAMTQNGAAYYMLYKSMGLPVTDIPVQVALQHGALGAGLTGTGPAVAALFDKRVELPKLPSGQWAWTKVA